MDAVANVISYDLPDDVVHYNPANNGNNDGENSRILLWFSNKKNLLSWEFHKTAVQKDVKSYERGYLLGLRNRPESLKKPTVTARWLDDDDFEVRNQTKPFVAFITRSYFVPFCVFLEGHFGSKPKTFVVRAQPSVIRA